MAGQEEEAYPFVWGPREMFLGFLPKGERSVGENVARYFELWRTAEGGGLSEFSTARRLIDHLLPCWDEWAQVLLSDMMEEDFYTNRHVDFTLFVSRIIIHWLQNQNGPVFPPLPPPPLPIPSPIHFHHLSTHAPPPIAPIPFHFPAAPTPPPPSHPFDIPPPPSYPPPAVPPSTFFSTSSRTLSPSRSMGFSPHGDRTLLPAPIRSSTMGTRPHPRGAMLLHLRPYSSFHLPTSADSLVTPAASRTPKLNPKPDGDQEGTGGKLK